MFRWENLRADRHRRRSQTSGQKKEKGHTLQNALADETCFAFLKSSVGQGEVSLQSHRVRTGLGWLNDLARDSHGKLRILFVTK